MIINTLILIRFDFREAPYVFICFPAALLFCGWRFSVDNQDGLGVACAVFIQFGQSSSKLLT